MSVVIEKLRACLDADELHTALHRLCTSFGPMSSLRIVEVAKRGKRQMLCFLRFESTEAEHSFSTEFNIGSFGGELVMIINLHTATVETISSKKAISKFTSISGTWKLPGDNDPQYKMKAPYA